jgi:hypothetical protein
MAHTNIHHTTTTIHVLLYTSSVLLGRLAVPCSLCYTNSVNAPPPPQCQFICIGRRDLSPLIGEWSPANK